MAKAKTSGNESAKRPPLSPEAKEAQMISLAMDLAEEQLRAGTASSQVISHFLKLATSKSELEKLKLEKETELLRAKTDALQAAQRMDEMYAEAIKAMQQYSGNTRDDGDDYEY